jgi:hypothetical protein
MRYEMIPLLFPSIQVEKTTDSPSIRINDQNAAVIIAASSTLLSGYVNYRTID